MRKFLVVLVFFVGCLVSNAQETGQYGLYITNGTAQNDYKDLFYTSFYIRVNDGTEILSYDSHQDFKKWDKTNVPDASITEYAISSSDRPRMLRFHTRLRTTGVIWEDKNIDHNIDCSNPPMSRTLKSPFWGAISESTVEFKPIAIKFWYFEGNGSGTANEKKYLPYDNEITLKATQGFPSNIYNWQYRIEDGDWNNFPAGVQYNANKSNATFTGATLFSNKAEFIQLLEKNKNISFRINTLAGAQEVIVLSPTYSVPNIIDHKVTNTTCKDKSDGTVTLIVDRPRIPNEQWEIYRDGYLFISEDQSIDGTEIKLSRIGVMDKEEEFSISGSVNGYPSYVDKTNNRFVQVKAPTPIEHEAQSTKNVSCYDGKDGQITVAVIMGDDANYTAKLYSSSNTSVELADIKFSKSRPGTFSGLGAGYYDIRVWSDPGGCLSVSDVKSIEITQPGAKVAATVIDIVQPLGFGGHDGKVSISFVGGTPTYTAICTHRNGTQFINPTSSDDGDKTILTFSGLSEGDYTISCKDALYDQSTDPAATLNCGATTHFYMPQPPPLEIEIQETHFVNCYGSDEGQLTAHAKGGAPYEGRSPYNYRWSMVNDLGEARFVRPNDSIAHNLSSGRYKVEITDKNGIDKLSQEFFLGQPDSLSLRFEVQSVGCSGLKNGAIEAFVTGGTEPYVYQWSLDGQNKSHLEGVGAGIYMFKVTDARGCQLIRTVEVPSASGLKVESAVIQPTCRAPQGGQIELKVTGATPPYNIQWSDSPTTEAVRSGLSPGKYEVVVSDANNCSASYSFNLAELKVFSVSLGDDLTICRNQLRVIEAVSQEKGLSYTWFLNGTSIEGTKSELTVTEAGVYKVIATNPDGCTAWDEMTIKISREVLDLDMAIPTTAAVGTEIHAVNLSTMAAERIVWNLPQEAQIKNLGDTEAVFAIPAKGSYSISMEGFKGDCSTKVYRTLTVVGADGSDLPENKEPLIRQFLVTPNPSTGYFKVLVELNREENFTMLLYAPSGVLMDRKEGVKMQNKTFEYEINGTIQGTYLLHLQTKVDKSVLQVVVERK